MCDHVMNLGSRQTRSDIDQGRDCRGLAFEISVMADLALGFVNAATLLLGRALRQGRDVLFKFQLQHRREVFRHNIESSVCWIDGSAAPIRSSVVTRHLYRIAGSGRSKETFIAGAQ